MDKNNECNNNRGFAADSDFDSLPVSDSRCCLSESDTSFIGLNEEENQVAQQITIKLVETDVLVIVQCTFRHAAFFASRETVKIK